MAAELTIKRKDSWPKLKAKLEQENETTKAWEAVNLSSALKVKILLKGKAALIEGTVTGPSGGALDTTGKVEYAWITGDTNTADTYKVEFEIEWSSTHFETIPNGSWGEVLITEDLGGH